MNISQQLKIQKDFAQTGQSIWIDNISRDMILNNTLKNMIEKFQVTGLTSNPTIFEQAISSSNSYDESIKLLSRKNISFEDLAYLLMIEDIQRAADMFMDVYKETNGNDGYVSIEIPPSALKKEDMIKWAQYIYAKVSRANLMIKIPSTEEGILAMEELVKSGVNVNMTLLFSPEVYEKAANAYIRAIEYREKNNLDTDVFSVASFFVSRIDTFVDAKLEELYSLSNKVEEKSFLISLKGKAAVSIGLITYSKYLELFYSENFKRFAQKGFKPQKLLWASTSTKNPSYKDTFYADELCLKNTINTMPTQTLYAFFEHGSINKVDLHKRIEDANSFINDIKKTSMDLDSVFKNLLSDGLRKFTKAYQNMLKSLEEKTKKKCQEKDVLMQIYNLDISSYQKELKNINFIKRLYSKDATLWKSDKENIKIIKNSLGWLEIPYTMSKNIKEIQDFTLEILGGKKFKYCVLLGMGGSSLAAEVLRSLFEKKEFLKTYVLDSTNPEWIGEVEKNIDIKKTLFIFSSKSGSTVEPNSQFKYFYSKLKKLRYSKPGDNFIAITDFKTSLNQLAEKYEFRKIFINPPDMGGRFSALSYFGLVPASLLGADISTIISIATDYANRTKNGEQSAIALGSFIAANALNNRDKLTIILPPKLKRFGLWIEQLIAESTGKEGKGVIPVIDTKIYDTGSYDNDRMFVILQVKDFISEEIEKKTNELIGKKFPVVKMYINNPYEIAMQFYLWEIAVSIVGYFLKINPFDQPDVQITKEITKKFLKEPNFKIKPDIVINNMEIYLSGLSISDNKKIEDIIWELLKEKEDGTYYSICAYIAENEKNEKILEKFAIFLTMATQSASIYSYGPRYLHSTGQLFKGGSNKGIFIILTSKSKKDINILGEDYSFAKLCNSEAMGDFIALKEKRKKAIMIANKENNFNSKFSRIIKKLEGLLSQNSEEEIMPKTAIKDKRNAKWIENGYVVIDYPRHNETITSRHYTIRIGASQTNKVEVSIDNGPWHSARHSVGYWWYDWNNIQPGMHEIIAKMYKDNGTYLISKRRRCKVA